MKKKVVILGVSGMLGSTLSLRLKEQFQIYGVCNKKKVSFLDEKIQFEFNNAEYISDLIMSIKPNFVINCIGLIPQNSNSYTSKEMLYLNGELPHEILRNIKNIKCQFIQISTDCVFNGSRGNRLEDEKPDTEELYGISKYNGEIVDKKNLTLRTSIIGHELKRRTGLLEWFLSNNEKFITGYKHAYFSGLTTLELSNIIGNYISSNKKTFGLYQVSGPKISKLDLLKLINKMYKKNKIIKEDIDFRIDRSLNSEKALKKRFYDIKPWLSMINEQYEFYKKHKLIFK